MKKTPQLINSGKYFFQIQQYLKYFPEKQIKLICIEDLKTPEDFKTIYKFIGLRNPHNFNLVLKNTTDEKLIVPKYLEPFKKYKIIKNIFGTYHREGLLINRYFNVLRLFTREKIPYPKISNDLLIKIKDIYGPDIRKLSEYQNINYFNKWGLNNS